MLNEGNRNPSAGMSFHTVEFEFPKRMKEDEVMRTWIVGAFVAALVSFIGVPSQTLATNTTSSVEGIVVPDTVSNQQPFSFAVTPAASGTVDISSVSGEVVQHASTDKFGRVFLAAGLAAGAYVISRSHGKPIGKIEVQQHPAGAPVQRPMRFSNPPQSVRLDEPTSLSGHGFDPNCANMQISLRGSGTPETAPVLAATEDQLKLAPFQQTTPGPAKLTITNTTTGAKIGPQIVLVYRLQAHLVKTKLTSGADQTQMVIDALPREMPLMVVATVESGPVDFGGGLKETEVVTENGQAIIPVHSSTGSGPFRINSALSAKQIFTAKDGYRCSLNSGRCVPDEDYYCEETKTGAKWSCMSTKN